MPRSARMVKGHKHGRVPRAFREEQLLDVAETLFAAQGYQGTSIEDIATSAGVTRPMIYLYFRSKDGIYLACLKRARARMEESIVKASTAAQTPREQLASGMDAYLQFVESGGVAWEVLFGGGAPVAGPAAVEARKMRLSTTAVIGRLLRRDLPSHIKDPQIEAIAHMLSGAGEQLAKWWREHPEIPRTQVHGYELSLFWLGLERIISS
jgi:AcrR family transcriptional regulator